MLKNESKKIVIVGAGTFAPNVVSYLEEDIKERWQIVGLVDNNPRRLGEEILGYKIIGDDGILSNLFRKGVRYAVIGIGATAKFDMGVKKNIYNKTKAAGFKIPTIISKSSAVHRSAIIGEGVIVPPYSVIDPEVKIGDNVFLSPFVYLSHHVSLGNHIFISSFANFVGGVSVGDESFIGMSATVCKDIGKGCNIYPNTLVMSELDGNMIAFGNPMKKIPKPLFSE